MTDRELLELAAKAAGYTHYTYDEDDTSGANFYLLGGEDRHWNPLTDDNDALQLAATLRLDFNWWHAGACIKVVNPHLSPGKGASEKLSDNNDDASAALRRAIVRAAAAMTKEQQP